MVAASVVATMSAVALLTLGGDAAQAGTDTANRGLASATGAIQVRGPVIASRGDIDVDGNDIIDLAGADIQAIVSLNMLIESDLAGDIDLTPPYTVDDTGVDPDFSTTSANTVISVQTDEFSVTGAAWTVTFPGDDDGDSILDKGERAELTVWLHQLDVANGWYDPGTDSSDPFIDTTAEALVGRGQFTLRITPNGAPETALEFVLPIELTETTLLQ